MYRVRIEHGGFMGLPLILLHASIHYTQIVDILPRPVTIARQAVVTSYNIIGHEAAGWRERDN